VTFGLPLEGITMVLGVEAFLDMARTSVNLLGNCVASVVMARWEGQFNAASAEEAEMRTGSPADPKPQTVPGAKPS
jgi:proton glutamate symport protein